MFMNALALQGMTAKTVKTISTSAITMHVILQARKHVSNRVKMVLSRWVSTYANVSQGIMGHCVETILKNVQPTVG